jgi:flavin-binding protein dodecin
LERSPLATERRIVMPGSVYKIIELVGTSPTSWEEAVKNAVDTAGKSLRDLRIAEISKLDVVVENGKVTAFRARVNLSFKYEAD